MNPILAYFDLNNRATFALVEPDLPGSIFAGDVEKNPPLPPAAEPVQPAPFGKRKTKRAKSAALSISVGEQVLFYLGTVIGVLFSSAVLQFQVGKAAAISLSVITLLLSAIIALVIMPFVYKKAIEPEAPFIIKLGVFVQAGVFWSVVFSLIGKAYG